MNHSQVEDAHARNRHRFAIMLIPLQIIIAVLFGIFVRVTPHTNAQFNQTYYPLYQDVNVMMLVGFGFSMAFMKQYSWSAISYTFFINSVMIQLYILLSYFWTHVFKAGWGNQFIYINQSTFIAALNSTAAQLIALGVVLGRTGPSQIFLMGILCSIGYTLNEQLIHEVLKTFDSGGSMRVHTFGAAFGLSASFILGRIKKPTHKIQSTYTSITFALLGTLFLWVFFPSFNAGYYVDNDFQRSLIIANTVLSLTGSCLATFAISALFRDKFNMKDILHSTIAGGVIIAAPCGVATNSGICLTIGLVAGAVSSLCLMKLNPKMQRTFGIYDTCGMASVHGVVGLLGGWISAMVIASYQTSPGLSIQYQNLINLRPFDRTYSQQAGIQVSSTFISLAIGLLFGVAAGFLISIFYHFQSHQFYRDAIYFQLPAQQPVEAQNRLKKKTKFRNHKVVNRQQPSHIQLVNNSKISN